MTRTHQLPNLSLGVAQGMPLKALMMSAAFGTFCVQAQTTAEPPAETASVGQLNTVTVTAERTAENVRNVPSSVSTLSGEKLDVLNSSGQDVRLLSARVPSLTVESSFGRAFPRFYIRGYGNTDFRANASQPVSLVYDDIVQENPLLKGFPIFDLDRVEVLAGPQGTLFGRNSPAGVVKFDSAKPRLGATDGYANLSYGRFQTMNFEGAMSIPLGETTAARVAGIYQRRDDWVSNTRPTGTRDYEGYDDRAIRAQLLYKPNGVLNTLFNIHARDMRGSARVFRANIIEPGTNDLVDNFDSSKVSLDATNSQSVKIVGGNIRLSYELTPDLTFNSITGYETVKSYSRADVDGGYGAAFAPPSGPGAIPFPVETADGLRDHHQFTQELRLSSKYKAPLNWQAGVYLFDEKFTVDSYGFDSLAGGRQTSVLRDTQESRSYAAFGSLRYDVTPALQLRGGLRYTQDKKALDSDATALPASSRANGTSARLSDSKPSGDLGMVFRLDDMTNVYARVATGYRGSSVQAASGFGVQSLAGQENNVSYEAGIKGDLLDKRARVSASVFRYRVNNFQLTENGGGANTNTLLDAKKVIGQGLELNLDAYLLDQLLITVSGSYNYTKIKSPGLSVAGCGSGSINGRLCTITDPVVDGRVVIDGNPLPNAPRWIGSFTARYGIPLDNGGEIYVFTDWAYRSKINFALYESRENVGKALTEGGLRIGYVWGDGKYDVAGFVRNITNKVVATGALDFNNLTGFINDPRTWGLQIKSQF